jgi:CubicO group peptidase (beta-lactamase class C family)
VKISTLTFMFNYYLINRVFCTRSVRGTLPLIIVVTAWAAESHGDRIDPPRLQSAIEQLDDLASKTLERTGVAGIAIAVVHGDEIHLNKGYGVREWANHNRSAPTPCSKSRPSPS